MVGAVARRGSIAAMRPLPRSLPSRRSSCRPRRRSRRRPRRVLPARHRRRRARRDAAARLDRERRPELARRLRRLVARRLPGAGDRSPRPRPGLRALDPFRLVDCAGDAAAVLRELDRRPAIVVGYSMGGAIAQLVARDHPDAVAGIVLERHRPALAGARDGQGLAVRWARSSWRCRSRPAAVLALPAFAGPGFPIAADRMAGSGIELMRHSARDIAEAGRELGRFDSRPWLGTVQAARVDGADHHARRARPAAQAARARRRRPARSRFEAPIEPHGGHLARGGVQPALLRRRGGVRAPSARPRVSPVDPLPCSAPMRRARYMLFALTMFRAGSLLTVAPDAFARERRRPGLVRRDHRQGDHQRDVPRDRVLSGVHRHLLADPVATGQAQARKHGCRQAPRSANADWRGGW